VRVTHLSSSCRFWYLLLKNEHKKNLEFPKVLKYIPSSIQQGPKLYNSQWRRMLIATTLTQDSHPLEDQDFQNLWSCLEWKLYTSAFIVNLAFKFKTPSDFNCCRISKKNLDYPKVVEAGPWSIFRHQSNKGQIVQFKMKVDVYSYHSDMRLSPLEDQDFQNCGSCLEWKL